jgi:O-antigen ligase
VDVSVEEVRSSVLPSWFPRPRVPRRSEAKAAAPARAVAIPRVAAWEWGVTVLALVVLGRLPVLFLRRQMADVFGGPPGSLWQEDLVVTIAFAVVQVAVIVVALFRSHPSALLRQPALLAFLAFAWLSVAWSVEPSVSARRVLLFAGAAGVGWYIGDRFSLREHIRLVCWLGGVAAGTTLLSLFVWNELARSTNGSIGKWSGMYVNRNSLGLVLSLGLLGLIFQLRTMSERRGWLRALGIFMGFVLIATKSRSGPIALVAALAVALVIHVIRRVRGRALRTGPAAYVVFATLATGGLFVHWYWYDILHRLGRAPDLSARTFVWQLVRWFTHLRPWTGWGFEAIWANERAIGQAQAAKGSMGRAIVGGWPFSAHNGYYEVILGVGYIGFAVLAVFLAVTVWRAFERAWLGDDVISLWPISLVVFALTMNFSESLFISSEAMWVLVVATAVAVSGRRVADEPPVPIRERFQRVLSGRSG